MSYPSAGKDRAAYWQRHLDQSTKVLENRFELGRRMLHLYENEPYTIRELSAEWGSGAAEPSRVKPSLVYAWIEQSIANMLQRNPKFRVTAKRADSVDGEVPVGRIINYWYEETDQMHQDRRCLMDAFLYGFAVKKVGWMADVREDDEVILADESDISLDDPEEENLWLATGAPTRVEDDHDHVTHIEAHRELLEDETIADDVKDDIIRPHIDLHEELMNRAESPHQDVREESPFGLRVWPEDFRIDPLARDGLKDARWIAFRSVRPIDEVRDNPNYSRQAVNSLEAQRIPDAPDLDSRFSDDDGFGMVTIWEVWARNVKVNSRRRRDLLVVIAEQGAKDAPVLLRHEDEWPYDRLEGYPACLLTFGMGSKTWLQKPSLALAGFDNMQSLLNETLDSFLGVVRKQKNVVLYDSNVFSEDEVELALAAPDGSAIGVPGLASAPGAVQPLPFLSIPNDKGAFIEIIQSLADRSAGTPQPLDSGSDTATESAIKERRTTAREGLRVDAFERFQVATAEAFWRMHTQFQPDMEVEIDPRAREFSAVDDRTVRGNYRFNVDVSSAVESQSLERKQWLDLLNLLSGLVEVSAAQGQPPPDLAAIAEQLLTRGYDIQNPEDLWPAIGMQGQMPQMPQMPGMEQQPGPVNRQQFGQPAGNEAAQMREAVSL